MFLLPPIATYCHLLPRLIYITYCHAEAFDSECLLFQFYKIESVYYFSFIKLKVSTFLVYKVKKCLLKSGKVIQKRS